VRLLKSRSIPVLATTIVAAFQLHLAAAVAVSEDVPVAGGTAAWSQALGIDAPLDRARFIAEITRLVYDVSEGRTPAAAHFVPPAQTAQTDGHEPPPAASADLVPVPLTAAIWSDAVFRRRVPSSGLVAAILGDRQAALLCHGLAGLDDATLQFLVEHPAVLTDVYEHDAAAFAVFASSLHIRDGRVAPPGGDAAVALWEGAVGEEVTQPDHFVPALFSRGDGRLAYLYDSIGQLDPPRAAFALGFWIQNPATRAERFKALTALSTGAYHEWRLKAVPFARPIHDVASLLMRVRAAADGTPLPPASRTFWARVFESADLPEPGAKPPKGHDDPVDAAWLAQAMASGDVHQRGDRFDQFGFGQRAFAAATSDERGDVLVALRGFVRYRMLMLTLDRLGITTPAVYAAAARHASRLTALDHRHAFTALAQFQGLMALVVRMRRVQTIDRPKAEALVTSLVSLPISDEGYGGGLLDWVGRELRPMMATADDVESGLIAQLAGAHAAAPIRVTWEGQRYRLDLAGPEDRRLHRIREKQGGVPLDFALDLETVARSLAAETATRPDVTAGIDALTKMAAAIAPQPKSDERLLPPGAEALRDPHESLVKAVADLRKVEKSGDVKKAAHAVEPLTSAAEAIAGEALLSIAYALDLGDPDGTALLAGNVAWRHDFGFGTSDPETRARTAWSLPKQEVAPGVPWHVSGSALGLDVALAPLALRRVDTGRVSDAPKLTSNERQTFAVSVALMNPFALTDAARDAIAGGIVRGRARVAAVSLQTADALADAIAMDGWRRRAAKWSIAHDPGRVASMFSLTELLSLGGVDSSAPGVDAWGMSAFVSSGCLCTHLAPPGGWWNLTGRPQLGLLATTVADLNLHIAATLHDLGLPAAIARNVLSAAVQDYIDEVRPNDNEDWLTLVRAAQAVPRERIEDYVAEITADGPLVPDTPSAPGGPW
jgi:hypothetical protein